MSLQVEKLEKSMAKLTIEVSADEFEKAMQKAYLKNKGRISVQGFRKGKAPRKMIEHLYGPGVFYEDAANEIIPKAYESAAKESGLDIVARPEIDVTQIGSGKNFIFTALVAIKPEVTLGQYKGVTYTKVDVNVTDDEVEQELKKVQEQNARTITVEDRPVAQGDLVVIDFEGFVDGKSFEGGKGKDYELTIGSHSFIDTFEDQLVGKNVGDDVEVNVTFPDPYQAEELAGKPALFKVKINGIKVKELPELDDEFASDVSDFETLAEYKESIKKEIKERKEKQAASTVENEVVDAVVANAAMDIPQPMIDANARNMISEFEQRIKSQGLTLEQYMQYTGMDMNKMLETMKPQAEKQLKIRLTLEAVVDAEKITASDEDVDKEIDNLASMYQMDAAKLKEYMGAAERENMKLDIAVQKAVDFVVAEAVMTEKKEEVKEEVEH